MNFSVGAVMASPSEEREVLCNTSIVRIGYYTFVGAQVLCLYSLAACRKSVRPNEDQELGPNNNYIEKN